MAQQNHSSSGLYGAATLAFFIDDRRYSVPTLQLIDAMGDDAAIAIARRLLDQSAHHTAVEARDGERVLCRLER